MLQYCYCDCHVLLFAVPQMASRSLVVSPLDLTPNFVMKDLVIYPPTSVSPQPPYSLFRQSVNQTLERAARRA